MRYRFRYAYYHLGELIEGDTVVVRLRGSAPNVLLLDRRNFERYRAGLRFAFVGGLQRRSPVRLQVPRDGHWYVAADKPARKAGQQLWDQGAVRAVKGAHSLVLGVGQSTTLTVPLPVSTASNRPSGEKAPPRTPEVSASWNCWSSRPVAVS